MKTSNLLTLGFSSCPNDTFIFDALVHKRIDTHGLEFDVIVEDVEKLNHRALSAQIDLVKISYHAYLHVRNSYALLDAGSALGHGCGPLVIARKPIDLRSVSDDRIGIPGRLTTANLLLQLFLGRLLAASSFVFNEIEGALLEQKIDAGVIIHENRFTYESKGLVKIVDLGEYWEDRFSLPIPLGCIAASRRLHPDQISQINGILRDSVGYARAHPEASRNFVKMHAQDMDDEVIRRHIDLYVTNYTEDLGPDGRAAVDRLESVSTALMSSFA